MLDYVIIEARRQPQNEMILTKRIARNQRIGVGRTDSADLVLNDPEISSLHFLVAVSDDACTITDQNSTNKTYYNGKPITQINIGDGERILCGKTEFIFRLVSTFDDRSAVNPFVNDQPKSEASIQPPPPAPAPKGDATSHAERSTEVKRKPVPPPVQSPPSQRPQAPVPESSTNNPVPPASTSNHPSPATPTNSGDLIDWNLFSEEGETDESEETHVIAGQAPVGKIVQVTIGIAGHSEPADRLVIDPRKNPKTVVGRAASADLPCPQDPAISSHHFAIEIQDNQCLIRDLNSRNGTAVNGQQILIAPLRHGDRILAGKTEFEVAIK